MQYLPNVSFRNVNEIYAKFAAENDPCLYWRPSLSQERKRNGRMEGRKEEMIKILEKF